MANAEQLKILKTGVIEWNSWRRANPLVRVDLREADLSRLNLRHAYIGPGDLSLTDLTFSDIREANLSGANLTGANLSWALLVGTEFVASNLTGADLIHTNFSDANLTGANLAETNMLGTLFAGTLLRDTNFHKAAIDSSFFFDVDLSAAKGIDTILHSGPSSIGVDSIYRSKGKIPVAFLRGAGVPENFIEYMHSLVGAAFEYYSCFISYSTKDQDFATRIHADLQNNAVRCWFAPHDVQGGKKLHEQIDIAIRLHERLLLILSPNSINSEWVKTEISKARKREITEGKKVLFPIRLNISFEELQEWECFDADRGKDSAREVREYYIPDFSQWKDHDQYQTEFKKLLKDLKKETLGDR